ncbi:MAG TPA: cytochrome P450, partial [Acidimicrobiales bacterium]|nr:cytochrome P450 [Acidimicrobiales bacterium]
MELSEINLQDQDQFVKGVPHEAFRVLRDEAPAFWQESGGAALADSYWAVTRHEDVVHVNRDVDLFSSGLRGSLMDEPPDEMAMETMRLLLINMDPPMHTRYRRLVNKGFTPRMIALLEEKITWRANQIIDRVCEQGSCDFVKEISAELPLQVIAELLGVPEEDRHLVFDWSNRMIGRDDPEYGVTAEMATSAAMELYAYADELTERKRANPHEDLLSILTRAEIEGDSLNQLEIDVFFLLLSVAGNETTRNLISGGTLALMENPDQRQLLLDDPSLLGSAIEEMLRYVSPVMHFRRTARHDTEIAGQKIAEGDKIVFWHISANRDERVFDDPMRFDVRRSPNDHVAFGGGGPHFCLGANL